MKHKAAVEIVHAANVAKSMVDNYNIAHIFANKKEIAKEDGIYLQVLRGDTLKTADSYYTPLCTVRTTVLNSIVNMITISLQRLEYEL